MMLKKILLACLLIPFLGLAKSSDKIIEFAQYIPENVDMALVANDLNSKWKKIKKLRVWQQYKKLEQGRKFIEKFNQNLQGLETLGFSSDVVLQIFKNRFAVIVNHYQLPNFQYAFLISVGNQKDFFEEMLERLNIFSVINNVSPNVESYLGFKIISFSSNFVYVYLNKFIIFGNSSETIHSILDTVKKKQPSLFGKPNFKILTQNLYKYTDFYLYTKQINQLSYFSSWDTKEGIMSGRLTSKIDLKLTTVCSTNSSTLRLLRKTYIPHSFYAFIPKNIYYAMSLTSKNLMPLINFKSNALWNKEFHRNQKFYADFQSLFNSQLGEQHLFICKPFFGSTNFGFVFSADNVKGEFYSKWKPSEKWLITYRNKQKIFYYKETKGSPDKMNYFALVKNKIVVADSLKMMFAILDAYSGKANIKNSESFQSAYSLTPNNKKIFFIFNTMKWANIQFNDTNFEYLKSVKKFSSFITLTTLDLRNNNKNGFSVLLKSFPIVK